MKLFNKLERKFGRFGIPHLTNYIIGMDSERADLEADYLGSNPAGISVRLYDYHAAVLLFSGDDT